MGRNKKAKKQTSLFDNQKKYNWLACGLIFVLVFVLYGNTLFNKFALDDHNVILNNEQVQQGISAIPEIFSTPYSTEEGLAYDYRPLVKASFALEYSLYGLRPFMHHLINLLLYALSGIILFRLLRRMLQKHHPLLPLIATLIFIAHPIHTEVVASLKNRDEIISLIGALMALSFLFRYADSGKIKYLGWMAFFFVLGMLGKRTTMTYLAVFPFALYFFTDLPPKKIYRTFGLILGIFFLVMIAYIVLTPQEVRPLQFFENPLYSEGGFLMKVGTAFTAVAFYLKQLFVPYPMLSYYGFDAMPVGWNGIWPFAGLFLTAALLYFAFKGLKSKNILSFSILFFFITISIVSNILVPVPGIVADRFALSPSIVFSIMGAILILKLAQQKGAIQPKISKALLILIIILIPYTVLTIDRNKDWKNHLTLFSNDAGIAKSSIKLQALAAEAWSNKVIYDNKFGRDISKIPETRQKVISYYQDALKIYPENYEVLNNLGSFLSLEMREYEQARPYLEEAVQIKPDEAAGWFNLGFVYEQLGDLDKAEKAYKESLKLNPDDYKLKSYLANLYFKSGKSREAFELNEQMAKTRPDWDQPYINMGNYYLQMQDTLRAISQWEQAIERYPQYQLGISISRHYRAKGDEEKSKYFYRKAMQAYQRDREQTE